MPGYGAGLYGAGLYGISDSMITSLLINIAGTNYDIDDESFSLPDKIEEASKCAFRVIDPQGIFSFKIGQRVVVTDALEGNIFTGRILSRKISPDIGTCILHEIEATDKIDILDGQTSNRVYNSQYAGAIAVDQIKDQWVNGILANFAIDQDTTQADFKSGNLNGVVAANNVEDGNLELAPAGTTATITESTTSNFNNGTLTNCTASSNTLAPSATPTIKLQATESLTNDANAYIYFKIFSSGSISVISGRYLEYDIWISSTSPEIKASVDIIFTDGSTLRDLSQTYLYKDDQNIGPHPGNDQSGFADGKWRHRKFLLDNFTGKTISHVDVAIEGDKGGTYTAYFKNILYTNGAGTTVNTFFSGSLNTQKQMQNSGYSSVSLSVVSTYDCTTSNRVSPSYNLSQVSILKSSFISWTATQPTNTNVQVEYSIDGGNSYTVCTNNAALPNLPTGLSLSGKSIQFRQTFQQLSGALPDAKPILTSMRAFLYPSYAASKSDATVNATTNSQWNAGSLSSTQAVNNILLLLGAIRNWDTADLSSMSIFGGGSSGPSPTTVRHHCNLKSLWVEVGINLEGRSRLDFAGNWGNLALRVGIYIDSTSGKPGLTYRTTNSSSNFDLNYAYCVECTLTSVSLARGSNSNNASLGTRTVVANATISIASASWHVLEVVANGSNHQIILDGITLINATDGTYTAAGAIALRASNSSGSAGYQAQFQEFGVTVTGLSGTWVSPSQSLTSLGTYLASVISWQDVSIGNQNTTILVESTINGGGSFQTVSNGGSIPNLTAGQSLSGVSVQFRITESTQSASSMPQVQGFVARVLGGFSSSGTRINRALLLTPVGTCGSTLVSWNAITPAGTSVAFATSLDGTSYTSVSNGGSIAGLNQQPTPTIDSFNLISSGSYTSTARTGGTATSWIWDTNNSRLTVSGGTNALLIYGAISCKDVDVYFDLDQADNCGVVWRWTDASNYYELLIFDASSSAGSTNILKLFKVVANVKTQLGSSTAITLKRSDAVKRARVLMIGTAITVFFDGTSVLSTTDSSLVVPGKVGLSNVSGIGRIYNLRIQPQGDNLSGKFVYVKQTLTSTVPDQTPQITDMTALVTNPNIGAGSLVPIADYRNTYKSDNIKDAAKRSDYYHNVKPDGSFIFLPRQTVPSPWAVTVKDILAGIEVDDSADLYRNRHTLTGVQSTIVTSEIHTGDGSTTSFTLKFPVSSMTSIALDGQTKTFGLKGTSGYDFYYAVGDNSIAQDSGGTVLQNIVDQLVISYTGQTTTTVTRDNTGQFPGTVSQKDYIDQSGISIPVQVILNQASAVVSTSGNSDDLDVSLVKRIAFDANITAQSGTSPTLRFFVDRKAADGSYDPTWDSGVISTLTTVSTTIGKLCTVPEVLGTVIRIRWTIGGSSSPSKTFSISIQGRVDPQLAGIGIIEAVEDVSDLNLNVAAAQALGDSRLRQYGVQGRTFKFRTKRTGLAAGQYASIFLSSAGLNDASMLITSATRTQMFKMEGGQPSQSYFFDVEAVDGPSLTSWAKTLNDAL